MAVVQMTTTLPSLNEAVYADSCFILGLIGHNEARIPGIQAECQRFAALVAMQDGTIAFTTQNEIEVSIVMQRAACEVIAKAAGSTTKELRKNDPQLLLPAYDNNINGINNIYATLDASPYFKRFEIPITIELVTRANEIQRIYAVDYGDAIHYALAEMMGVTSFVSTDQDFLLFANGNSTIYVDNATFGRCAPGLYQIPVPAPILIPASGQNNTIP